MLVFVDESGDTGLKFNQGSSTHFAVTLVMFADAEEAERVRQRVDTLRAELRLPLAYDFRFFSLVVDKRKLLGGEFQSRASFYRIICGMAFEGAKHLLHEANVKFDEGGEKSARKELASFLNQKLNATGAQHIKKIGTQDPKVSNLIQIADMVCGAVYRSYQNEADAAEYRNMIKHRENSVLLWPLWKVSLLPREICVPRTRRSKPTPWGNKRTPRFYGEVTIQKQGNLISSWRKK